MSIDSGMSYTERLVVCDLVPVLLSDDSTEAVELLAELDEDAGTESLLSVAFSDDGNLFKIMRSESLAVGRFGHVGASWKVGKRIMVAGK